MPQLAYQSAGETATQTPARVGVLTPTVSLFGDLEGLHCLTADARGRGLNVRAALPLESLLDDAVRALGEVVIVACSRIDARRLAGLVRLDERAQRAGAQVVVVTGVAALEDVFGCLESASAQILVDPTPAQQAVALGAALVRMQGNRVRELDESERLALLRLTEEVGRLAAKIDGMAVPLGFEGSDSADRLAAPGYAYRGAPGDPWARARTPLPDSRSVHLLIHHRRLRDRFFDSGLFADPAWDILLDLLAARIERRRVSVTSLCIAAAVPATTALRWIAQMTEMGILVRERDEGDRRRAFIGLSDNAAEAMARYFAELAKDRAS